MSLTGLEVRLAAPGEVDGFSALLAAHHYLGSRGSGPLLRYIACLDGEPGVVARVGGGGGKARPVGGFRGGGGGRARSPARAGGGQPAPVRAAGRPPAQ